MNIFDKSINLGYDTNEPTLRELLFKYYRAHLPEKEAKDLMASYILTIQLHTLEKKGLFVSFTGTKVGVSSTGWLAVDEYPPILTTQDFLKLEMFIQKNRGYRDVVILHYSRF